MSTRYLQASSADRSEILHDDQQWTEFYNVGPKFRRGALPKIFYGPKTFKIWADFGQLQTSAANVFKTNK